MRRSSRTDGDPSTVTRTRNSVVEHEIPPRDVVGDRPVLLGHEHRDTVLVPGPGHDLSDDAPRGQRAARDLDVAGRCPGLDRVADLVELQPEDVGRRADGLFVLPGDGTEHRRVDRDGPGLLAHPHQVDQHLLAGDAGAVDVLLHGDLVDSLRERGHRGRESFEHEPGVFTGGVEPGPRPFARLADALVRVDAVGGQVVVRRRGDDVLARREQCHDVIGVGVLGERLARGVEDEVGVEGQDRRLVVRRRDPRRRAVEESAGVDPDLPGVVDEHSDELQVGPVDDLPELRDPDRARRPLHHADRHGGGGSSSRPSMVPCRTLRLPSGRTRRATRNSLPTQPLRM